jgi:lysophospholipid acyltransferase (LPLAT)-like uncharacterized protein
MPPMKITSPLIHKFVGLAGAMSLRAWLATLDVRVAYYDPAVDPTRPEFDGQKIFIFWHEYLLAPLNFRAHCNVAMLVSRHRDGAWLAHAAHHLGFAIVRGSTGRGGTAALRELLRKGRHLNLATPPDGPRGPRRVLAPGTVYLASKLGMPIVALGLGYDRPCRLKSWDRFAIPRPFSRLRSVAGPAMHIPADLDREGLEYYRREVERMLNRLTEESEAWAASGRRKPAEVPGRRQPARLRRRAA